MRGSMQPRCDVREVKKALEEADLENKDPIYDDGRIIVEERHLGLKAEPRCSMKKQLAVHGLQ